MECTIGPMPIRTTAVELARERGWTMVELSKRSGLSLRVLYYLRDGRQPGTQTIEALRATFPEMAYEELFVPTDCTIGHKIGTKVEVAA